MLRRYRTAHKKERVPFSFFLEMTTKSTSSVFVAPVFETPAREEDEKEYEEEYEEDNKKTNSTIKKEELFEGGIVKPDLETSLKELHPFAISIRQLSKRIGEDNVFLVVTHCGDDYVEKRDWCELIDVPPENVTFCQTVFRIVF